MTSIKTQKSHIIFFGWIMWFIAAIFYALDYFQHTAPAVLLQPIADSLNMDITTIGSIMSIYFPVYAISQLPAGYLLDKFKVQTVLSINCIILSIGLLCIAYAYDGSLLILGRVLIGIGSAFAFLGALKVASMWIPEKYFGLAVGLTNTIGVCGGMFGEAFLNYLISNYGWQNSCIFIAIFGFIFAVILFLTIKTRINANSITHKEEKVSIKQSLKILKYKEIWLLSIYAGIMVGVVVNAFSELYDVIYLEYAYKLTSQQASFIASFVFIGIAVGGPLHGIISNLFNNKKTWLIFANISTSIIFALIITGNLWANLTIIYILYFSLGFFVSSMLLSFSIIDSLVPEKVSGFSLAFLNMMIGLSGAFFQPLLGKLFTIFNGGAINNINNPNVFIYSFLVILIPLIISFLCCVFSDVKKKIII